MKLLSGKKKSKIGPIASMQSKNQTVPFYYYEINLILSPIGYRLGTVPIIRLTVV